jgi:hypothetical protein
MGRTLRQQQLATGECRCRLTTTAQPGQLNYQEQRPGGVNILAAAGQSLKLAVLSGLLVYSRQVHACWFDFGREMDTVGGYFKSILWRHSQVASSVLQR